MKKPPPPPPTLSYRKDTGARAPTYWLHSEEGGMTGPYTKKEARELVAQSPGVPFLACREGEDWQDAAVRLAHKKSNPTRAIVSAILIIVLLVVAGFGFKKWQDLQSGGNRAAEKAANKNSDSGMNNASSNTDAASPGATTRDAGNAANGVPADQAGSPKSQPAPAP
jgi:hypothetical protein